MYRAWETTGRQARITLAKRALAISPLCADAYVLLAEESAESLEEAKALYARGVEAGELALGPKTFKEDVGYFWGLLETRPYMRARAGLAQALWTSGSRDEAIAHYREMLRLNPGDNQGPPRRGRPLERACPRLSERRERTSQDCSRLHHPGRRGRGGRVRAGLRRGLEAHGRRARLAPAGGRGAPTPVPPRPSGEPLSY